MKIRRIIGISALVVAGLALTGCSSSSSLSGDGYGSDKSSGNRIVVGSQDYYSNEIIAEIYAQALEREGFDVDRQFRIGQRETYMPDVEAGKIDVFPEYSGPLLQYWDADATARSATDVLSALVTAAPDDVDVLPQSSATDEDVYVVTRAFAEQHDVQSLADLASVGSPITLGGASEGEDRPNGPAGLEEVYGATVRFTPIEDGGGPLTVKALQDGSVQLAVMYSADPAIADNDLVMLRDPESLMTASNVVPIVSDRVTTEAQRAIERVGRELTPSGLVALNRESVDDQQSAAVIAKAWLRTHADG
jgi:osmoprotectant transport system substrate-binding protein